VIGTVLGNTVGTYTVSAVGSDAAQAGVIGTVLGNTVGTYAVSTVGGQAVGAYVVGAVGSDALDVGMGRAVFSHYRGVDVFGDINSGECEGAGCQYGEGQADDQFVGFHVGSSRSR